MASKFGQDAAAEVVHDGAAEVGQHAVAEVGQDGAAEVDPGEDDPPKEDFGDQGMMVTRGGQGTHWLRPGRSLRSGGTSVRLKVKGHSRWITEGKSPLRIIFATKTIISRSKAKQPGLYAKDLYLLAHSAGIYFLS